MKNVNIYNPKKYTQVFKLEDGSVLRIDPNSASSIKEDLISVEIEDAIKRKVVHIEPTPTPVKPIELPKGKPQNGDKKVKSKKEVE